jgi:DNA excision repair protein ERCC-4
MSARKNLEPSDLVAIIDTREQLPLDLSPMQVQRGGLQTGDYSLQGLEDAIAIERKSLPDLVNCIGSDRDRFERELVRLRAYPCRAVVVESTWAELLAGQWRSKVTPAAAIGSVLAWVGDGIPFLFVGTHEEAGRAVARLLFVTARRHWRTLQTFQTSLRIAADVG